MAGRVLQLPVVHAVRCGWCSSTDVDYETVYYGLGMRQVTATCRRCDAVEIGPYEDPDTIHPVDKARGWYAGPNELRFVKPMPTPPIRDEALRAWLFDYGTLVLVPWFGLVHTSYVEKVAFDKTQFRTNCGLVFEVCALPYDNHTTCLFCLCEETACPTPS